MTYHSPLLMIYRSYLDESVNRSYEDFTFFNVLNID